MTLNTCKVLFDDGPREIPVLDEFSSQGERFIVFMYDGAYRVAHKATGIGMFALAENSVERARMETHIHIFKCGVQAVAHDLQRKIKNGEVEVLNETD